MIAVARKNYDLLQLLNSRRDREECLASVCHTTQLIHSLWTPACTLWATVNSPGMNIGAQIISSRHCYWFSKLHNQK